MLVGAGTVLGHDLALELAERAATVIITDQKADPLLRTARAAPDRIQTLECDLRRPEVSARIGAIWGAEPVSALVNLLPLGQPGLMEMVLRSSVGLGRGFRVALVAGRVDDLRAAGRGRPLGRSGRRGGDRTLGQGDGPRACAGADPRQRCFGRQWGRCGGAGALAGQPVAPARHQWRGHPPVASAGGPAQRGRHIGAKD